MTADPARSFGTVARQYDRARPGYPDDALRWVLGPDRRRVLDLGAGTGKLTATLVRLGHDVVAVEPDPDMAGVLSSALGGIEVKSGVAEAIPLADASVDAIVAGQAYHWFDRARAIPEMARVLRPGGVVGLLWNVRDEREPWVAELTALLDGIGDSHSNMHPHPEGDGPPFGAYEHRAFAHVTECDPRGLRELITSRSYVITATPSTWRAVSDALDRLLATHPALAGRSAFPLPYVTHVYRAGRA